MSYYEEGTENPVTAQVLTAAAGEANTFGYAIFVVNNHEMIVPTLDEQNNLTGWTKVAFDHIAPSPTPVVSLFAFDVEESDLQQLIGETVKI